MIPNPGAKITFVPPNAHQPGWRCEARIAGFSEFASGATKPLAFDALRKVMESLHYHCGEVLAAMEEMEIEP
jgi:hypothetical protein